MASLRTSFSARAKLLMDQPFFGTLALRLKVIETDEVDTAATDGSRLIQRQVHRQTLLPQQLIGLIAHEVIHCVFTHIHVGKRDPKVWNVACDYAITHHCCTASSCLKAVL